MADSTMPATPLRLSWPWLAAFFMFALFAWGARPLWEPDEGRYGETAREMVVSGNWLVPHLQGQPHLTKPPLTYWLAAFGLLATGVGPDQPVGNAWGARFCVGLAFFGTILCVAAIAAAWGWPRRAALLAALIFASSLLPFAAGHLLTTDMPLTFFETFAILAFWRVRLRRGNVEFWRITFWAAFGFAFLTKGPPGLLPLLVIVAFAWMRRDSGAPRIVSIPGIVLMLVIALTWYAVIVIRIPGSFEHFVKGEFVDRLLSDEHERGKSQIFYLFVILVGIAPWLHLWPAMFARTWRSLRPSNGLIRGLRSNIKSLDDPALFSFLWFLLPLIVFQISSSKMYLYVLPLMAPLAIWFAALHIERWPNILPTAGFARGLMMALAAFWCVGGVAFAFMPDSAPFGRSYRALATVIRDLPMPPGQPLNVEDGRPESISFYSGRLLEERDKSKQTSGPYMKMLVEMAKVRRTFLLTKEDGMEDLADEDHKFRLLVTQHEWSVVEILPEDSTTTSTVSR